MKKDLINTFGSRVLELFTRKNVAGVSAQEVEDLCREVVMDTCLTMKVIAVRNLQKKGVTLERRPKQMWSCTVTLESRGELHKPATLDMDQNDTDRIPECGDVLLVHRPRVLGYANPKNPTDSKP